MMRSAWRRVVNGCCLACARGRAAKWPRAAAVAALACAVPAYGQETCQTATPIPIGVAFESANTLAQDDPGAGLCVPMRHDVWHTITPTVSGAHTISLCGSAFDTGAALYDTCFAEPLVCNDDACGQQSQIVASLAAGTTYILRIGSVGPVAGPYRVEVTPPNPVPPSGNGCGSGVILPPNQTVFGNTSGAFGSDVTGECGGGADRADVWYNFNPSASGLHIVELCSTAFDAVLSVHTSCFNSQVIACSDDDAVTGCPSGAGARVTFNATAGSPVIIRVAGAEGGFGPYSLTIHTARANDTCANAAPTTRGHTFTGFVTPALSTEGTASCVASGLDVWHAYIATATAPHVFSLCDSSFDTVLSVHSGCPGQPGAVELACADNGCDGGGGVGNGASQLVLNLQAGQLYLIRIAGRVRSSGAATGAYALRVDYATPANDDCANPTPLVLGQPVVAVSAGATGSDISSCGANDTGDVWYSFTAPNNGIYEFNTCGSTINTILSLFSNCGTELGCSEVEPNFCGTTAVNGSFLPRLLSGGVTYLVRVAGVGGLNGTYRLVVNRAPPLNDSCAAAQPLALGVVSGGTLSAAAPSGVPNCVGADTADVFFSFVPPETRHYRVSTCGSAGDNVISITPGCPPAPAVACAASDVGACGLGRGQELSTVLLAGTAYNIRISASVTGSGGSGGAGGAFQIVVEPSTPPNDECGSAIPLTLDVMTLASTVGASGTDMTPCGASDQADVWYRFTPEQSGSYEFITCSVGQAADTTLALFDICDAAPVACNDDAPGSCGTDPRLSRLVARLDAGRTYLLRAATVGGGQATFNVGVRFARPLNDNCFTPAVVNEGVVAFDTLGADSDLVAMEGCGLGIVQISNDVWFRFTPPVGGQVTVDTCESDFDTALAVLDAATACSGQATVLACSDDYNCDGLEGTPDRQSRTAFQAAGGQPYLIRVGSVTGDRGAGLLRITRAGGPSCPCDWNGQGGRSVQDVFDFLQDWFRGQGDFNQSGVSDLGDLFDFLTCFLTVRSDCP